nr:IS5 family transposase [Streptomyces buecherae]
MDADLSKRLVPDELWRLVAPLLPSFAARPQGGGTAPRDQRAVFTAVVYVLTSGCAWRHLPPTFGTSSATAHRRFTVWTEVGLWRRLHRAVLDEHRGPGRAGLYVGDRRCGLYSCQKGGIADRADPGRSQQEGQQAARAVRCSGHPARRRCVRCEHARQSRPQAAHPRHPRSPVPPGPRRRRPVKLGADKAYFSAEHLIWLRERGLVARIARPSIECGERLGRHRWKIERSIAWLFGYRRLTIRYERKGSHFLAFLGLAAALTCYKKLAQLAT